MKRLSYIFASLMLLAAFSCSKPELAQEGPDIGDENIPGSISFVFDEIPEDGYTVLGEPETKSYFDVSNNINTPERIKSVMSDLNYYLFKNGVLFRQGYYADYRNASISVSDNASYNLYVIMNFGTQKSLSSGYAESRMASEYSLSYPQNNYNSRISTYGLPGYAKVTGFTRSFSGTIHLTHLTHTLRVRIDKSLLPGNMGREMEITSMSIKHGAYNVKPFAASSKSTTNYYQDNLWTGTGQVDYAVNDDIARLNRGEEVVFYLLENMSGTYSAITNWKDKIPSNLPTDGLIRDYATYLEFTCDEKEASSLYEHNIYRCFLGNSPSDFNVRRNESTVIIPTFTKETVIDDDWVIEQGEVTQRSIGFKSSDEHDAGWLGFSDKANNVVLKNYPTQMSLRFLDDGSPVPPGLIKEIGVGFCVTPGLLSTPVPTVLIRSSDNEMWLEVSTDEVCEYMGVFGQQPLYAMFPVNITLKDGKQFVDYIKVQKSAFNFEFIYNAGYDLAINGDDYANAFMRAHELHFAIKPHVSEVDKQAIYTTHHVDVPYYHESTYVLGQESNYDYMTYNLNYREFYCFPSTRSISWNDYGDSSLEFNGYSFNNGEFDPENSLGVLGSAFARMMTNRYLYCQTLVPLDVNKYYYYPGVCVGATFGDADVNQFSAQLVLRLGLKHYIGGTIKWYSARDMVIGGQQNADETHDYHPYAGELIPIHFPGHQHRVIDGNMYNSGCTQDYCKYNGNRKIVVNGQKYYRTFLHRSTCFRTSLGEDGRFWDSPISQIYAPDYDDGNYYARPENDLPVFDCGTAFNQPIPYNCFKNPSQTNWATYLSPIELQLKCPMLYILNLGNGTSACYYPDLSNRLGLYIAFRDFSTSALGESPLQKYYLYALQRAL